MDTMWSEIRANNLSHKGINHWVYEYPDKLFVGVELHEDSSVPASLEHKHVLVPKYAYGKHIGAYSQLGSAYATIISTIRAGGFEESHLNIEIYGHDAGPATVPETEILIGLK